MDLVDVILSLSESNMMIIMELDLGDKANKNGPGFLTCAIVLKGKRASLVNRFVLHLNFY